MIKRYNPDYAMHSAHFEAFARETPHGEYIKFTDHQQALDALEQRINALAVTCSFYREAISKARRLINVGEMGDADDVLAKAERELLNTDAALAAIEARGVDKMADKLDAEIEQIMRGAFFYDEISSREAISKMVREFSAELREAK